MRRQALDRERAGDADAGVVGIGLVVEILELGLGADRRVDLLPPRDPRRPPLGVQLLDRLRPVGPGRARDFPFLPWFAGVAIPSPRPSPRAARGEGTLGTASPPLSLAPLAGEGWGEGRRGRAPY